MKEEHPSNGHSLPANYNETGAHSFCVLPWVHRFVNLTGEVQLCCTAEESEHSYLRTDSGTHINIRDGLSDTEIDATAHLRDIRRSMLRGDWPAACERCRVTESTGCRSRRQAENEHFSSQVERILAETDMAGFAPVNIRSRDYRLGNLCNLRCRMCHPRASKLLMDEWNEVARPWQKVKGALADEYRNMTWFQNPQMWTDFSEHCHLLEHLHFAGGEPLVIPEVLRAMEICVDKGVAGQIELTFNTNAMQLPKRHRELWPEFRKVNLLCSVDAQGALNDYIRYPAKWSRIEKVMDTLDREHEALNLSAAVICVTVQAYNIFHLDRLIEYCHDRYTFVTRMPNLVYLSIPDYFNVQHLPNELKAQAGKRLRSLRDRIAARDEVESLDQLDGMISYLQGGRHSLKVMDDFRRVTEAYDRLRGESLTDLVPELTPLMKSDSGSIQHKAAVAGSSALWYLGKVQRKLFGGG